MYIFFSKLNDPDQFCSCKILNEWIPCTKIKKIYDFIIVYVYLTDIDACVPSPDFFLLLTSAWNENTILKFMNL